MDLECKRGSSLLICVHLTGRQLTGPWASWNRLCHIDCLPHRPRRHISPQAPASTQAWAVLQESLWGAFWVWGLPWWNPPWACCTGGPVSSCTVPHSPYLRHTGMWTKPGLTTLPQPCSGSASLKNILTSRWNRDSPYWQRHLPDRGNCKR